MEEILKHERIEEIIIIKEQSKLSFKKIYEEFKKKMNEIKQYFENKLHSEPYIIEIEGFKIEIHGIDYDLAFNIICGDVYFPGIYLEPIEAILEKNEEYLNVEIIHNSQIDFFQKKYEFEYLSFYCNKCKSFIKRNNIRDLYSHYKHSQKMILKERLKVNILNKEEFKKFFKNEKKGFIGKKFKTPIEFENNFLYYFSDSDIFISEEFEIFENENNQRNKMSYYFSPPVNMGKFSKYFGSPYMGKTVTLIGVLKHNTDHCFYQTLYINCKKLTKNLDNIIIIKQILINEISYLFYGCYDKYYNLAKKIQEHQFQLIPSIWEIIEMIISQIESNKKSLIIVFDQYNNEVDKDNQLTEIYNNYIKPFGYKRGLLVVSSMNNNDIKMMKIRNMFKKEYKIGEIFLNEINEISINLTLDLSINNEYDEIMRLYGNNLKMYNIIKKYKENPSILQHYLEKTRKKIENNLKNFYEFNNDLWNVPKKLMSFSVNSQYSKEQFLSIYENIHFKYFNVQKKGNVIYIKYAYPLIEIIINEFYNKIFLSGCFYEILTNNMLDGGARGQLFEKVVINYLGNKNYLNYFNDISIQKQEEIDKFLPKKNEKNWKIKKIIKKTLEKKIYLLTQKQYTGKAFDCLIVLNNLDEVKIICLQISIHKGKIYTIDKLKKYINSMIEYLTFHFEINIKQTNVYFSYIFDFLNMNGKKIKNMLEDCQQKKIKYFFFDSKNEKFVNESGDQIKKLFDNTICLFYKTTKKRTYNQLPYEQDSCYLTKTMKASFILPEIQVNAIKSILIDEFKINNNVKLNFLGETFNIKGSYLMENHILVSDLGEGKILLIYCNDDSELQFKIINQLGDASDYKVIPNKFYLYQLKFNT